ncbi:hypothetical protein PFISCL1PPCAC_5169, partial [Pristionchus fissidentatus]
QMPVTVLMVAEKPMLADSIARLLSDGRCSKRKGMNKICSVSEYQGDFMGQHAFFKVTSTCGHVMGVDFPAEFNNWHKTPPVSLYDAPIDKVECTPEMKMNRYLASEAKGVDYLVLWLDCDKEGENICFEVIDAVQGSMRKPRNVDFMSLVYRAHFSAITEFDIKAAMRNLGRPDMNVSLSVEARRELDLRVGCSFTRFQSMFFKGKYAELDGATVSYGPCQTPTLAFCVNRHDEIVNFRPDPYWIIQTTFEARDGSFVKGDWARGRVSDPVEAQMYLNRIQQVGGATVTDINTKRSERNPPHALNTVKLMRAASTQLGLAPATTMHVAESLYTQGYISYPRTETSCYPPNFDLRGTLSRQCNDQRWGNVASRVMQEGINRPRGGFDKGDHPPITPMRSDPGALHGDNARVYEYVVRHFIATLMKNCVYEVTTAKLRCGEEEFSFQGKQLIDPGFTVILNASGAEKDVWMPRVERGDQMRLRSADVIDRPTTPPCYLTESELISMMEHHGIGTDASIPVHINTICQRNYVTVEEQSRRLIPTQLGVCVIHGYRAVDPELVLPTIRADLERQLELIATGQADFMTVKSQAVDLFKRKFLYFLDHMPTFDARFAATFTVASMEDRRSSVCSKCRVNSKTPGRLYCQACSGASKRGADIRSAGVVTRGSRGGRGRGGTTRGAMSTGMRSTRGAGVRGALGGRGTRGTRGTRGGRGASSARGGASEGGDNANMMPLGTRGGATARGGGRGTMAPPLGRGNGAIAAPRGRGSGAMPPPPPFVSPAARGRGAGVPPPMPPPPRGRGRGAIAAPFGRGSGAIMAPPPLPMPPPMGQKYAPPPPAPGNHHQHYNPPPPLPMPPPLPQFQQQQYHQASGGPSTSYSAPAPRHPAPWPTDASPPKRLKTEPAPTPPRQPPAGSWAPQSPAPYGGSWAPPPPAPSAAQNGAAVKAEPSWSRPAPPVQNGGGWAPSDEFS